MRRRVTLEDYERRILLAQHYIEEHLDESIEPAALAKVSGFSLHHFHRIFRAQLGESVVRHVRRLRIERAARKLRGTNTRIIELAFQAGYESHEAFTRAFIERFGIAPSGFRQHPSLRLTQWESRRDCAHMTAITVAQYTPIRIAFLRHRGSYCNVGETFHRLIKWSETEGLTHQSAPFYAICPDDAEITAENHLRLNVCVSLPDDYRPPIGIALGEIPGGTYAVGTHVGPYETLRETYLDVIGHWFPRSGYALAAEPVIEHYLNDPGSTAPEQLATEVRVRIAD